MLIRKTLAVIFTCLLCHLSFAQFADNLKIREKFSYDIIQIEEFNERFNFDNNTKLLKYIKEDNPDIMINRRILMSTLVDTNYFRREARLINDFMDFVCDTINPVYLNFYDKNWYAEVSCILDYKNQIETSSLILMNQSNPDSSSKWIINGASSKLFEFPNSNDSMGIMSPTSHGTGFISLYNVFKDGKNIPNYITEDFVLDELTILVALMYFNKIILKEVSSTKYHYLQIPGWAFTLEYINRKGLNSGWLITDLQRLSQSEKEIYKKEVLNIYSSN